MLCAWCDRHVCVLPTHQRTTEKEIMLRQTSTMTSETQHIVFLYPRADLLDLQNYTCSSCGDKTKPKQYSGDKRSQTLHHIEASYIVCCVMTAGRCDPQTVVTS